MQNNKKSDLKISAFIGLIASLSAVVITVVWNFIIILILGPLFLYEGGDSGNEITGFILYYVLIPLTAIFSAYAAAYTVVRRYAKNRICPKNIVTTSILSSVWFFIFKFLLQRGLIIGNLISSVVSAIFVGISTYYWFKTYKNRDSNYKDSTNQTIAST